VAVLLGKVYNRESQPITFMSLAIEQSTREDIVILALGGRLTFRESDDVFDRVRALGAAGHSKVVLDLRNVSYVDSAGLGAIVGGYASLTKLGGALKLVSPNKRTVELLLMTQLNRLFEVFDEVRDAVESFAPRAKSSSSASSA
jgi:anti-sigma B factor antagonist